MPASGKKPSTPETAPPATGTDHNADWDADEGEWRHAPVAPKDQNPLRSLGESIGDVVTGSGDAADPARPRKDDEPAR